MGCGPSKEQQNVEASSMGWSGAPKSRDPLLGAGEANGSSIRAKIEAANNVVSQTQHVHRLGPLTLTENPLHAPDLDDLLLLEEYQASEEPVTPDLTGVAPLLRPMLLPGGGVPQVEGESSDEDVSRVNSPLEGKLCCVVLCYCCYGVRLSRLLYVITFHSDVDLVG